MKSKVNNLKKRAKELGYNIKHTHALELFSIAQGEKNYNTYKALSPIPFDKKLSSALFITGSFSLDVLKKININKYQSIDIGGFNNLENSITNKVEVLNFINTLYEKLKEKKEINLALVITDFSEFLNTINFHMYSDHSDREAWKLHKLIKYGHSLGLNFISFNDSLDLTRKIRSVPSQKLFIKNLCPPDVALANLAKYENKISDKLWIYQNDSQLKEIHFK